MSPCRPHLRLSPWLARLALGLGVLGALVACSSDPAVAPQPLAANPQRLDVRQVWHLSIGTVSFPLNVALVNEQAYVADDQGSVYALNVQTGQLVWRVNLNTSLTAGVGADAQRVSVVTRDNQLVTLEGGREVWRRNLPAAVFTAPLVAGGRVFVLSADRAISAFDGASGRPLWTQQRPGEPLVLKDAGVMFPVSDTLMVGLASRLVAIHPGSGAFLWDVTLATTRGTNDIERLIDLSGRVSRVGDSVCAQAFQATVSCVDVARGSLSWSKPATGYRGVHGTANSVFGVESNGRVQAWKRANGERLWSYDGIQLREPTAPLVMGAALALGDAQGHVHFLAVDDGRLMGRVDTDGSGIQVAPVLAGRSAIVVTRKGGVFALRPE